MQSQDITRLPWLPSARRAETERLLMKELTEQGLIAAVYVAADQSNAWAVWNVDSEAALEEAHNSLPLHPYMSSEITVLAEDM